MPGSMAIPKVEDRRGRCYTKFHRHKGMEDMELDSERRPTQRQVS
jgi:hypothetical protein